MPLENVVIILDQSMQIKIAINEFIQKLDARVAIMFVTITRMFILQFVRTISLIVHPDLS